MPKIPDDIVQRITETAQIEEVVGDILGWSPAIPGGLRKTGVRYTAICPFHDDKHDGNFIVYPKENCYRCFTCDAKGGVVTFLMEHERLTFPDAIRWLGRKYNIETDDIPLNYTPPPPRPKPVPLPPIRFKRETVAASMRGVTDTVFVKWLQGIKGWNEEQRARIPQVLFDYCVATSPHGNEWVTFWQITYDGTPLTAKHMKYQPNGHRVKDRNPVTGEKQFATDWEHAWRARQGQYDADKYDTSGRTLFGMHLLKRYPDAIINVVESEKTALVMSIAYGEPQKSLWLASGGMTQINYNVLKPLIEQKRTIYLYPDMDGIEKWRNAMRVIGYDRMSLADDTMRQLYDPAYDPPKADIADIILRRLEHPDTILQQPQEYNDDGMEEVLKAYPPLRELHKIFKFYIAN
ncbi:MAG: hypothetical protein IIZ88_05750 [Prevotella sp.]|nr:hypothetical protein [Prevotella sp.]